MKKFIVIVFGVLLIGTGGYLFFSTEKSVPDSTMVGNSSSESEVAAQKNRVESDAGFSEAALGKEVFQNNKSAQEISHTELQDMTEAAQTLRNEIDDLILEFDANLADPETRKEMKNKIDAKLAEYNKMILPVAINEMSNSAQ